MTRESKVGIVVASTFACLLSVVVVSKLRPPEPAFDAFDQSEPPPVAQTPPPRPIEPLPSNGSGAPSLPMGTAPALAKPLPEPRAPVPPPIAAAPKSEPVVPAPIVQTSPVYTPKFPLEPVQQAQPKPGQLEPVVAAPAITPPPVGPKVFVGPPRPEPSVPATKVVTGEPDLPKVQVPALPTVDPLLAPLPPPMPVVTIEPKPAFPGSLPASPQVAKPVVVAPAPITLGQEMPDPLAVPPIPVTMRPEKPEAMPPVPVAAKEPNLGPPPLTVPVTLSPPTAAPKPINVGTIGTTGNEVNVAPVKITAGAGTSAPVPAIAASGRELPRVDTHSDDVRNAAAGDTFAQLSQRYYGSDKYAAALLEYNRRHVLGRSNPNLQQNPPVLQPNQAIFYPHPNVLEGQFGNYVQAAATTAPTVQISPPMPLAANPPTADPTQTWTVRETQHIFAIAQQTLGNGNLWTEILRLNPALRTDQPIPAGTQLRLPVTARTN